MWLRQPESTVLAIKLGGLGLLRWADRRVGKDGRENPPRPMKLHSYIFLFVSAERHCSSRIVQVKGLTFLSSKTAFLFSSSLLLFQSCCFPWQMNGSCEMNMRMGIGMGIRDGSGRFVHLLAGLDGGGG